MSKIKWDGVGEKRYETGTDRGVLYPTFDKVTNRYTDATAWNGLTGVTENPSGADSTDIYADNIKYASIRAAEKFGATIQAYTYPDEFAVLDGSAELTDGVTIGQQDRGIFGFSYRTLIGDDEKGTESGYKIHLVYGCSVSPSGKDYSTVNESPDPIQLSWELSTTPVPVTGFKPTATLVIDSTRLTSAQLKAIENVLYGTDADPEDVSSTGTTAYLPLPDEVKTIIDAAV